MRAILTGFRPNLLIKAPLVIFYVYFAQCLLMFSFSAGDFVSGLRPNLRPLGGLQDGHEAGFLGTAKRYYNFVFTDLAGKCFIIRIFAYVFLIKLKEQNARTENHIF